MNQIWPGELPGCPGLEVCGGGREVLQGFGERTEGRRL